MYFVTRTFRDANGVFKVGSAVEPTDVKAFKSRLQQRHIINVDEQNIDKWSQYFINRHGIDISETLKQVSSGVKQPSVEAPVIERHSIEQQQQPVEEVDVESEETDLETEQSDDTQPTW